MKNRMTPAAYMIKLVHHRQDDEGDGVDQQADDADDLRARLLAQRTEDDDADQGQPAAQGHDERHVGLLPAVHLR